MRRLTGAEFGALFDTFTSTAWRLETLQHYDSAHDLAAIDAWERGEHTGPPESWQATIRAARDRGARIQRVRLVVPPASRYVRWELGAYDSAEQVRVLEVEADHPGVGQDFWLFDGRLGVLMEYDAGGRFIAGHATEAVTDLRLARAHLTAASIPLADYLATVRV
jgi:hypothetical protein